MPISFEKRYMYLTATGAIVGYGLAFLIASPILLELGLKYTGLQILAALMTGAFCVLRLASRAAARLITRRSTWWKQSAVMAMMSWLGAALAGSAVNAIVYPYLMMPHNGASQPPRWTFDAVVSSFLGPLFWTAVVGCVPALLLALTHGAVTARWLKNSR